MSKRIAVSVLLAVNVPALWWLGGYDFNSRGADAVTNALGAWLVFALVYSYPGWDDK